MHIFPEKIYDRWEIKSWYAIMKTPLNHDRPCEILLIIIEDSMSDDSVIIRTI